LGLLGLGAKAPRRLVGPFASELDPLDGTAEAIERGRRLLVTGRRLAELFLRAVALLEHPSKALVARPSLMRGLGLSFLHLGEKPLEPLELPSAEPDPKSLDLVRELLRPRRGGRLKREGPDPLSHLVLEVSGAVDLVRDANELELGAVALPLEAPKAGCLLDKRPAIGRLRGKDLLDAPLPDHRVHLTAEPDVGEKLDQISSSNGCAVHEVLTLAASR